MAEIWFPSCQGLRLAFDDKNLPETEVPPCMKPDAMVFSAAWEWEKFLPEITPEAGLINLGIKSKFSTLGYNCLTHWFRDAL